MKVLQINKYYYKKGGAETVFFNTIQLLAKKMHTVIPFSLKHEKNESSLYAPYFVDYPELSESNFFVKAKHFANFFYNKKAAQQLEKLIVEQKPDIAHIHLMFNSLSVSILPILHKYKIPTIMSVHDYRLVCPAYTFKDGKGNICECCQDGHFYHCVTHKCSKGNLTNSLMLCADSYFRKYIYAPINYIDHFLFVSHFSMVKHIQLDNRFKAKSSYLYNFTPVIDHYEPLQGKYLLYFGRMSDEKGVDTLIEAARLNPDIPIKLAGTGPLLEQFKAKSPVNMEFLGFQQGDALKELIQKAAFVIVPSVCYENNPMSIIESFMLGTPVIGSNLGGIPELLSDGQTGYTFTPKSSKDLSMTLQKAMAISETEYLQMSENARAFALKNFSEENYYQQLLEVYQQLIQQNK